MPLCTTLIADQIAQLTCVLWNRKANAAAAPAANAAQSTWRGKFIDGPGTFAAFGSASPRCGQTTKQTSQVQTTAGSTSRAGTKAAPMPSLLSSLAW